MGPGLFLALALLCPAAYAETSVGLSAQGVDPQAALDNRWGLDVRDELGRPVTAQKVLAEMKAVALARAAANAVASRLPKARVILPALELLAEGAAAFRLLDTLYSFPDIFPALPGGRPRLAVLWLAALAVAALSASCRRRPRAALVVSRSRQSCPEVLRC
ncbi:MAG: hypothetical protein AAB036_10305 [Elusimicrobiota bacterium]